MNDMTINKEHILSVVKNLEFEEAISHRVHSRLFEVLGYISIIDKNILPEDVRSNLENIEKLNKKLIEEIHFIIEFYTTKKQTKDS